MKPISLQLPFSELSAFTAEMHRMRFPLRTRILGGGAVEGGWELPDMAAERVKCREHLQLCNNP